MYRNTHNTVSDVHPYRNSAPLKEWMGYTLRQEQILFLELLVDHGLDPVDAAHQLGHKMSLVMTWRHDKTVPDFKVAYKEALEMRALWEVRDAGHSLKDAKTEIAALSGDDVKKAAAMANLARSTSDHHKWIAARLDRDGFGDRTKVEAVGNVQAVVLLPPLIMPDRTPQSATLLSPAPEEAPALVEPEPEPAVLND